MYDKKVENPLVAGNPYLRPTTPPGPLPDLSQAHDILPVPRWEGHDDELRCYRRVWELGLSNLKRPESGTGFVAPFLDAAFNGCIFLWDSVFMLDFARYGRRLVDFQRTLDNFYAKQHVDGFICREIDEATGADAFHYHDPDATGPNLFAWSEWEHYLATGDLARLTRVYVPVLAYHQWTRAYRRWPDGGYWTSGWGCGMDGQQRLDPRDPYGDPYHYHGRMTWVCATAQAALSARCLLKMAREIGTDLGVAQLESDIAEVTAYVNGKLWDEATGYYYDRWADGTLSGYKTIASYWTLLAGLVPPERADRFIAHLEDEREFKRPHRVPALSADSPGYEATGGYWRGSIWPSTESMVLKALTAAGRRDLAHEIACNHLENVTEVFRKTGTVFENYAPESASQGKPAVSDFVGWGGTGPVAVLFEHVFGLRYEAAANVLHWDVRRTEAHGVDRFPVGGKGAARLSSGPRNRAEDAPDVTVEADAPLRVRLTWPGGGVREFTVGP